MNRTECTAMLEGIEQSDKTILMIKPHAYETKIGNRTLIEILRALVISSNLTIVAESTVQITPEQVWYLHPILCEPSDFGDEWKQIVVDHISGGPIYSFLVVGDDAQQKCKIIKKALRKALVPTTEEYSFIYNFIHTPDSAEFEINYQILFHE